MSLNDLSWLRKTLSTCRSVQALLLWDHSSARDNALKLGTHSPQQWHRPCFCETIALPETMLWCQAHTVPNNDIEFGRQREERKQLNEHLPRLILSSLEINSPSPLLLLLLLLHLHLLLFLPPLLLLQIWTQAQATMLHWATGNCATTKLHIHFFVHFLYIFRKNPTKEPNQSGPKPLWSKGGLGQNNISS